MGEFVLHFALGNNFWLANTFYEKQQEHLVIFKSENNIDSNRLFYGYGERFSKLQKL